jgi:hypothetical protein
MTGDTTNGDKLQQSKVENKPKQPAYMDFGMGPAQPLSGA